MVYCTRTRPYKAVLLLLFALFIANSFHKNAFGQGTEKYLMGEEKKLEIIVYILGEVQRPGEYRVNDNTNVVELIAKAGGPTDYSNLRSVIVTRVRPDLVATLGVAPSSQPSVHKEIIKLDVLEYLREQNTKQLPTLQPGDIVLVPKNNWNTWKSIASVSRDIAVIASAYFLYLRSVK